MTITPETITNLEDDCIHIAEVAVGKEGGSATGASIDTSTDRLGRVKKTLPKILEEMQDTTVSVLQLKNDLANTTDPAKGAGMVGVSPIPSTPTFTEVLTGNLRTMLTNLVGRVRLLFNIGVVTPQQYDPAAGSGGDDTSALQSAISSGKLVRIPEGTYNYTTLTGLDVNGLTIVGDGSSKTKLVHTGSGIALSLGTASEFRQRVNIRGFTVDGNTNTTYGIVASAIARSAWDDIVVRNIKNTGVGFVFKGCMLNKFDNLFCSTDLEGMTSIPAEGCNIEALSPYGNSSNNTFNNCYFEGAGRVANTVEIGVRISGGDQNVFNGGSFESCGTWGLLVSNTSRYNTFIGVGFENLNATGGDFGDAGISSEFLNCYSSQKAVFQGRQCRAHGGFYERVQIDADAKHTVIENITVNNWATGAGGYYDSGFATKYRAIYDADLSAFIYPQKDRVGESLAASPCVWTNNTGRYVDLIVNGGTVTAATQTRNGITWDLPVTNPARFFVPPGDIITITYTGAPTKFWSIPHAGL